MSHLFEPASSGRSKCRGCARPIQRGELRFGERLPNPFGDGEMTLWFHPIVRGIWRIRLVFYEEGRFSPGGFVHLDCRKAYFETNDVLDQVLHFSSALSHGEREELKRAFDTGPTSPSLLQS